MREVDDDVLFAATVFPTSDTASAPREARPHGGLPAGGQDVFVQKYSSGVPQGGEWRVNSFTTGPQTDPSAIYEVGSIVSWTSPEDPDGSTGICVQAYNDFPVELQTFTVE